MGVKSSNNLRSITESYLFDSSLRDARFLATDERKFSTLFRSGLMYKVQFISSGIGLYKFAVRTLSFANTAYKYHGLSNQEKNNFWVKNLNLSELPKPKNDSFHGYYESYMRFYSQNNVTDIGYRFEDNVKQFVEMCSLSLSNVKRLLTALPNFAFDWYAYGFGTACKNLGSQISAGLYAAFEAGEMLKSMFWFTGLSIGAGALSLKDIVQKNGYDHKANRVFDKFSKLNAALMHMYRDQSPALDKRYNNGMTKNFTKLGQKIDDVNNKIKHAKHDVKSNVYKRQSYRNRLYNKVTGYSKDALNKIKHIDERTNKLVQNIKTESLAAAEQAQELKNNPTLENKNIYQKTIRKISKLNKRLSKFATRIGIKKENAPQFSKGILGRMSSHLHKSRTLIRVGGTVRNSGIAMGRVIRDMIPGFRDTMHYLKLTGPALLVWMKSGLYKIPFGSQILAAFKHLGSVARVGGVAALCLGTFMAAYHGTKYILSFTNWKKAYDNWVLDNLVEPPMRLALQSYQWMKKKCVEQVPTTYRQSWYYNDPIAGSVYLGYKMMKVPGHIQTYKGYQAYRLKSQFQYINQENINDFSEKDFFYTSLYANTDPKCLVIEEGTNKKLGYASVDFLIEEKHLVINSETLLKKQFPMAHEFVVQQRKASLIKTPITISQRDAFIIKQLFPQQIIPVSIYNQTDKERVYDPKYGWVARESCIKKTNPSQAFMVGYNAALNLREQDKIPKLLLFDDDTKADRVKFLVEQRNFVMPDKENQYFQRKKHYEDVYFLKPKQKNIIPQKILSYSLPSPKKNISPTLNNDYEQTQFAALLTK